MEQLTLVSLASFETTSETTTVFAKFTQPPQLVEAQVPKTKHCLGFDSLFKELVSFLCVHGQDPLFNLFLKLSCVRPFVIRYFSDRFFALGVLLLV